VTRAAALKVGGDSRGEEQDKNPRFGINLLCPAMTLLKALFL
jgi:hypothetical protein